MAKHTLMSADSNADDLVPYVDAAAQLTSMPLTAERLRVVATVMTRIADFAVHLRAFELGDDIEIAGSHSL